MRLQERGITLCHFAIASTLGAKHVVAGGVGNVRCGKRPLTLSVAAPATPSGPWLKVAPMSSLNSFLERSQMLVEHLLVMLARVEDWDESPPPTACFGACQLSFEHSQAVGVFLDSGLPNAACAALKAQYEAVLRAA